jgi:hypothetical protein
MARLDSLTVGSNKRVGVGFLPTSRFTCDSEWGSLSKARQRRALDCSNTARLALLRLSIETYTRNQTLHQHELDPYLGQ